MAIDLYSGDVAHNPKDAKLLMMSVKQTEANDKYLDAAGTVGVRSQAGNNRLESRRKPGAARDTERSPTAIGNR